MISIACRKRHDGSSKLPYIGLKKIRSRKSGESEKRVLRGGVVFYWLHISRTYTVFYEIDNEGKRVIVQEILPIGQAHKKYG
jgi:mRNA-degrading endonuclease RelE of RelBE toxin-antitoxin system